MYTEEDVSNAVWKVLFAEERIDYSQEGVKYLMKKVKKLLPDSKVIITCQDLEEVSVQDREERKAPKITVTYQ